MVEYNKEDYYIDPITLKELERIKHAVINKDRDFVMVIDGEEGAGKSVLAQQFAKFLDPEFNIDKVCFNADQFIAQLKHCKMNSCIVLDEAFSSANSRATLTEVNRGLVGVATEMRQRNLFVIIVIPSFFDLDKYFALWRCRALFHVYFDKKGGRGQYIIFPKSKKKYLYLTGKKFYDYSKPASPYPPCKFPNVYTIDEDDYRRKKSEAFKKRTVSNMAKRWRGQRDALIHELYNEYKLPSIKFERIFIKYGQKTISQREIQRILNVFNASEQEETEVEDEELDNKDKNVDV